MIRYAIGSGDLLELAEEVIRREGSISFLASGRSMDPAIREGDLLTVRSVDAGALRRGDILLYRSVDRAVVHRMLSVFDDGLVMTCDARPWSRYRISRDSVLGRIESVRRGKDSIFLRKAPVHILLLRLRYPALLAGRLLLRLVSRLFSAASSVKFCRRVSGGMLKPFIAYRLITWEHLDEPAAQGSEWDIFQAVIFRRVVGSAQLIRFDQEYTLSKYVWIFSMRVSSFFRGAGIGRNLTRLMIRRASRSDTRDICLSVMETNSSARGLYEKCGFEELAETAENRAIREKLGKDKVLMIFRFHDSDS